MERLLGNFFHLLLDVSNSLIFMFMRVIHVALMKIICLEKSHIA